MIRRRTEYVKIRWSDMRVLATLSRGWTLKAERLQGISEQWKMFLCPVNNSATFKASHSASSRTVHERAVRQRLRKLSRKTDLWTASQCPAHLHGVWSKQLKVLTSPMGPKKLLWWKVSQSPAIPLWGARPKESMAGTQLLVQPNLVSCVIFTIATIQKQPRHPSTDGWIN